MVAVPQVYQQGKFDVTLFFLSQFHKNLISRIFDSYIGNYLFYFDRIFGGDLYLRSVKKKKKSNFLGLSYIVESN